MFQSELKELIRAGFSGIWVESQEIIEAKREIRETCHTLDACVCAEWSISSGLRVNGSPVDGVTDPLAVVRSVLSLSENQDRAVLVLENFHRFLNNAEVIGAVSDTLHSGKSRGCTLVIVSPAVSIPPELEKLFTVLSHDLPSREVLESIAREIAYNPGEITEDDFPRLLDASSGLTRLEAENAFSLSLVRHGALVPSVLWELKAQSLLKSGLLTLHRGGDDLSSVGGLDGVKEFCLDVCRSQSGVKPKGILLAGPPGVGKSLFAKCLGVSVRRPTLLWDLGKMLGGLVGQSEANQRQAFQLIEAMAPCVLFIDEIEKALAGVGGKGDSGVSDRLFGNLLTWLNDNQADVFTIATSNRVFNLPGEFARAGRFDGLFMLELPSRENKDLIWSIYREKYGIPSDDQNPADTDWTGAEIESCCRLAKLRNRTLTQAASQIIPVALTQSEDLAKLREWADGRCLSADVPDSAYSSGAKSTKRRKVSRDPSVN